MKRILVLCVAISIAVPSMGHAKTATQVLSLDNAAVQPVRASAQTRKKLKADDNTAAIILGIFTVTGGVCAVTCGGKKSR